MLKIRFISFVIFMAISSVLFSQNNTVKIRFSDAFLGKFSLSYEKVLNDNNSVQLKFGYIKPTHSPFISENTITPEAYTLKETN